MKSLRVNFKDNGELEITDEVIEDLACLRQNAMINIATNQGTDRTYPTKGTRLLASSTQGVIFDSLSAQHVANFAALSTLTFMRNSEYPEEIERTIETVQLELRQIFPGRISFQASFRYSDGVETVLATL